MKPLAIVSTNVGTSDQLGIIGSQLEMFPRGGIRSVAENPAIELLYTLREKLMQKLGTLNERYKTGSIDELVASRLHNIDKNSEDTVYRNVVDSVISFLNDKTIEAVNAISVNNTTLNILFQCLKMSKENEYITVKSRFLQLTSQSGLTVIQPEDYSVLLAAFKEVVH